MNILIVGSGSIGERHLRCFQQVGATVALCEPMDERRQQVAERYQLKETFAALERAAERSWDAAVICTPAHLHVKHAVMLASKTPALLIEKPLATNIEDVEQLRVATAGKIVQAAYVMRIHPAVQAVRDCLASGRIGKLLEVTVVAGQHFPTYRPAYREIYYARRETGGGAIQDAATHMFDLVQHLVGRWDWIFCDAGHQALAGVEVEDTVHLVGRIGGGRVMATVALNQFMAPNETRLQLNGDRGSLKIHFDEHRWGSFVFGDQAWTWSEPLVQERDDLFRWQAQRFLEVAAGRAESACSLDDAHHTLQVNLAALASAGTNRVDLAG